MAKKTPPIVREGMSLEHVLLTMLREPTTGYDLKSEFEAGAITFWPAAPSQIYSTLDRMDERGLLESTVEPSPVGPERRVYSRTEQGTERMRDWLTSGPVFGRERFTYIAQLSGLGLLDAPQVGVDFLIQLRHWFNERLEYLGSIETSLLGGATPSEVDNETFFDWAALQMGVTALRARVRCCSELLLLLEARSGERSRPPAATAARSDAS